MKLTLVQGRPLTVAAPTGTPSGAETAAQCSVAAGFAAAGRPGASKYSRTVDTISISRRPGIVGSTASTSANSPR